METNSSFQDDALLSGRDRRVRDKDAEATEDAASRRLARTRQPELHFETSSKTEKEILVAGFGGQGIVLIGSILGKAAAIHDLKHATMIQAYGPEARGGSCS